MFLIFLAAYRDRDHVEAATSSNLTTGTGDQDDAVALALASNMTAPDLDISEIAVARHRCQRLARPHTLKIHGRAWQLLHLLRLEPLREAASFPSKQPSRLFILLQI